MNVVIDGAGEVGSHLAKMLAREGANITVMDNDLKRLEGLAAYSAIETIEGDPSSVSALKEAHVDEADLFIATYPYVNQEVNMVAAMLAKRMGARKVVARVKDVELLSRGVQPIVEDMGIDLAFCPEKFGADEIVSQLRRGVDSDTLDLAGGKLQIEAYRVGEDSPLLDMTLVDFTKLFSTDNDVSFRVIAVSRGNSSFIPQHDTKFRFGDVVYITIRKDELKAMTDFMGVDDIEVNKVMIMGGGMVGFLTALNLSKEIQDVKLIELSLEKCEELCAKLPDTVAVVNGDGRNSDFLYEEGINGYDAFVAVTGNDEVNILACVAAKKFGVRRTVAEVENMEYVRLAEEMGVDCVINKKSVSANRIFRLTLSENARFVRYMNVIDAEVMEFTAAPDSPITKAPLRDVDFPRDALVGGIARGDDAFIAVGDTQVLAGDRVVIFTSPQSARKVERIFN